MLIAITGSSGFLGKTLVSYYEGKYDLKLIQKRRIEAPEFSKGIIYFDFLKDNLFSLKNHLKDCDVLFHCADSLDFSDELAADLLDLYQESNPRGKFVYFSSVNVAIPSLKNDPYTRHKVLTEEHLTAMKPDVSVLIVRPSFLISSTLPGNFNSLVKCIKKFGTVPIFVPGPKHYFLDIDSLVAIVDKELKNHMIGECKIINITGKEMLFLSDLVEKIALSLDPCIRKIFIPTKVIRFILRVIFIKPLWLKRKMKVFNDVVYKPSEDLEKIVSDVDINKIDYQY